MANGKTHSTVNAIASIPVGISCFAMTNDLRLSFLSFLGCVIGIFITPDADQEGLDSNEHLIVRKTFGLGFLYVMLWYAYARCIRHRSFISHAPVIGTVGRILYLGAWTWIILTIARMPFNFRITDGWIALFIGLGIADTLHWALDLEGYRKNGNRVHRN